MLNVVAIMGRLVADPTMRQTQTGKSVASVRIACDRGRRDANGQSQADFVDVVCWEHNADFVCKYFQKGQLIVIEGRLQSRNYQDKNGNNRTAIEIVANNINFAGGKSQDNNAPGGTAQSQNGYKPPKANTMQEQTTYSAGSVDDFQVIEDNDDLPF